MAHEPPTAEASRSRISSWRLAATVLLTAGLLALLLTQVSLSRIVSMIRGAEPGPFSLAGLAYLLSYVGRAWRWRILTPSKRLPWAAVAGITAVHNFMLRALPAKLGETSYVVLMRSRGVPGTEALAGLVVARIYDTAFSILFFVTSILLTRTRFQGSPAANVAAAILILGLCAFAVLKGSLVVRWVNALAHRMAAASWVPGFLLGHGVRRRLGRLESTLEGMQSVRQAPLLVLHTVLVWLPSFLMTWWLLRAFHHPLDFWGTVFASTIAIVATLLPLGTLGNFGTQEAGWTFGMLLLGVDRETAIATGFSTHLVGFTLAGIFGLIGAWLSGISVGRGRN